jgi:type I site-specific restriction-modification system R (restriction) subunit
VDTVSRLLSSLREDWRAPRARNYLIQHSVGSGKSLTIAALAGELARVTRAAETDNGSESPRQASGGAAGPSPAFRDSRGAPFRAVLILNDRLQLDQQLTRTVTGYLERIGAQDGQVQR